MADYRMVANKITMSNLFLSLHERARLLYYDFCIRADDDGFIDSPKRIIRITGASESHLDTLVNNNLLIRFDSGVLVIKHWKFHNRIRADIYNPTIHQNEKILLNEDINGIYYLGVPCSNQVSTDCQPDVSIGKLSQGKRNIEKDRECELRDREKNGIHSDTTPEPFPYTRVVKLFNSICVSYSKVISINNERKRLIEELVRFYNYKFGIIKQLFDTAESSWFLKGKIKKGWKADFNWLIKVENARKVLGGKYASDADEWDSIELYIYKTAYDNYYWFYITNSWSSYGASEYTKTPSQVGVAAMLKIGQSLVWNKPKLSIGIINYGYLVF